MKTRDPKDILMYKCTSSKAKKIINYARSTTNWQNYCSLMSFNTIFNQIWSTIKRFDKEPNPIYIPALKLSDISSISDTDKANMLASHFQSTNSNKNCSSFFINSLLSISYTLQYKLRYQSNKKIAFDNSFSIDEL